MRTDPEREYRLRRLREERQRIERRVYDDQLRLREIYRQIAEEVTAEAEGR